MSINGVRTSLKDDESAELCIGDDVTRLVVALPRKLARLASVEFVRYTPTPGVDQRTEAAIQRSVESVLHNARLLIAKPLEGVRWQKLLRKPADPAAHAPILQEVVRHDLLAEQSRQFSIGAQELSQTWLSDELNRLGEQDALGLCSRCRQADGSIVHLPMMDFRTRPDASGLKLTRIALEKLGYSNGAIVASGRSYHFYAFELVSEGEWVRRMAHFLLLSPVTDARYIAHRLIADTGVLRISASKLKPMMPRVVDLLG
jgi:hypothetical protein